MKILGIESSGLTASAAIIEDDILRAEFTISNKLTHSETLLPMIREMCRISGLEIGDTDAVAVSAGPGSFTGLRIGAATAKGIALSVDRPIISVPTLEAMAWGVSMISDAVICPVMDARRSQVYCAAYRCGLPLIEESAMDIHEFLAMLNALDVRDEEEFYFVGDGVPVHRDTVISELKGEAGFPGAQFNRQKASNVAELGAEYYRKWLNINGLSADEVKAMGADAVKCYSGRVMNSDDFAPEYLRKSQAERENEAGLLEDAGQHSLKKMRQH